MVARKWKNLFECKHCGFRRRILSNKKWIKSYCSSIEKVVHLMLVKEKK